MSEKRTSRGRLLKELWPDFWIPAEPEGVLRHNEACMRGVPLEYTYPRPNGHENVHTILDVGSNLGGFIYWATQWWPDRITYVAAYEPHQEALEISMLNVSRFGIVDFNHAAITTDPHPRLSIEVDHPDNWGGYHTHEATQGERVPAIHPNMLAAADVVKVDCEGSELEFFDHYQHLDRAKVVIYEYHRAPFRKPIMSKLTEAGLVMVRGSQVDDCIWDTQVWVRP